MMDPNVPLVPPVKITTGSQKVAMPLVPNLELHTKSLDEEKESVVDPAIPHVKQSVAHPVPMKLELLVNAVPQNQHSTPMETV